MDGEEVGILPLGAERAKVLRAGEPSAALLHFLLPVLGPEHGVLPVRVHVGDAGGAVVDREQQVVVRVALHPVGERAHAQREARAEGVPAGVGGADRACPQIVDKGDVLDEVGREHHRVGRAVRVGDMDAAVPELHQRAEVGGVLVRAPVEVAPDVQEGVPLALGVEHGAQGLLVRALGRLVPVGEDILVGGGGAHQPLDLRALRGCCGRDPSRDVERGAQHHAAGVRVAARLVRIGREVEAGAFLVGRVPVPHPLRIEAGRARGAPVEPDGVGRRAAPAPLHGPGQRKGADEAEGEMGAIHWGIGGYAVCTAISRAR